MTRAKTGPRQCHSCDRALRKGSSRRAWILAPDGTITAGIVCARCALRGAFVVVPPATTVPTLCSSCRREHASVCESCVGRLTQQARELIAANVVRARLPLPADFATPPQTWIEFCATTRTHLHSRVYQAPSGQWSWAISRDGVQVSGGAGHATYGDADNALTAELAQLEAPGPIENDDPPARDWVVKKPWGPTE